MKEPGIILLPLISHCRNKCVCVCVCALYTDSQSILLGFCESLWIITPKFNWEKPPPPLCSALRHEAAPAEHRLRQTVDLCRRRADCVPGGQQAEGEPGDRVQLPALPRTASTLHLSRPHHVSLSSAAAKHGRSYWFQNRLQNDLNDWLWRRTKFLSLQLIFFCCSKLQLKKLARTSVLF